MPEIPAERPLDKVRQELVDIPRAKAHFAMGFRGTTLSDPDRCPLDVLNEVLAGQGAGFLSNSETGKHWRTWSLLLFGQD